MQRMKTILKEPLAHFFLLGLVVFGLHSWLGREASAERSDPYRLDVTSADIEWLRAGWNKRMMREPTVDELSGLIKGFIREEVLYRQAVSMNLDQHDSVIRRRLAQKMEFLFEDLAETQEPPEADLLEYMRKHQDKYSEPARISFAQIYFDMESRSDALAEGECVLKELKKSGSVPDDEARPGDATMLPFEVELKSPYQTAGLFGERFSQSLFATEGCGWRGPMRSSYGVHLVYVRERKQARIPELEEVCEKVKTDYMAEHRKNMNDKAFDAIKSRYSIFVEGLKYE
ncbi:MAG: peptidyl-prolyl cis-trans isomerase [Planctomycetota bacterium]